MRTDRIVQRQNLKAQLQQMKTFVQTNRPLVEADKQLRRAYMAGYKKRLTEEVEEAKANKEMQGSLDPAQVDQAIEQELSQNVVEELNAVPTDEKAQIADVLQTKYPEIDTLQSAEQPLSPRQ